MFVEITRARSFKGLASYCLQDADRKGSERVVFAETRNLGTDDPDAAWRVMAARYYMQDELKKRNGIRPGEHKGAKPVGHLVLGWRDDEAEAQGLDRRMMITAAEDALKSIGADNHQAIIVAHNDTEHPHCHVIINLIGDDGRLKKNWKEREKLSDFALDHEREHHGRPIVDRRARHWEDRRAGETPEPVKKKPRDLYELDRAVEEHPELQKFADEHRRKLAAFETAKADLKARQKKHCERLRWVLDERIKRTRDETGRAIRAHKSAVRQANKETWAETYKRQAADRRQFAKNEQALRGGIANAWRLIDWKAALGPEGRPVRGALVTIFNLLTSEAARREAFEAELKQELTYRRAKQRQIEEAKAKELRVEEAATIKAHRAAYTRKAAAMKKRHARQDAALKERGQELTTERKAALARVREDRVELRWHERLTESAERKSRRRKSGEGRKPRQKRERRPRKKKTEQQPEQTVQRARDLDREAELQDEFERRMRDDLMQRRDDRSHDRER
ncbi:MAG: relaxase/mobilization nuclease domain-containing protein [Planctomycetota bacterium]